MPKFKIEISSTQTWTQEIEVKNTTEALDHAKTLVSSIRTGRTSLEQNVPNVDNGPLRTDRRFELVQVTQPPREV